MTSLFAFSVAAERSIWPFAACVESRPASSVLDDAVVRLRSDLDLERREREAVEEEILGLLDAAVVGAGS